MLTIYLPFQNIELVIVQPTIITLEDFLQIYLHIHMCVKCVTYNMNIFGFMHVEILHVTSRLSGSSTCLFDIR